MRYFGPISGWVKVSLKCLYSDTKSTKYKKIYAFLNGCAEVEDYSGNEITSCQYKKTSSFNNECSNGKVINKGNKVPINDPRMFEAPEVYTSVYNNRIFYASEGLQAVMDQETYLWGYMDENGNVTSDNVSHISAVSEETAIEYAKEAYLLSRSSGTLHDFRYQIVKDEDGYTIGFIDMYQNLLNLYYNRRQSVFLSITIFLVLFIIIYMASGKALEPMVQNMEKQKQFITDASSACALTWL